MTASLSHLTRFSRDVIGVLNIPPYLLARKEVDLRMAYQKYLAVIAAKKRISEMTLAGTWPLETPLQNQIIEIFISKSVWFKHYAPFFPKLDRFPQMLKWLEGGDDAPADEATWGHFRTSYSFSDLKHYFGRPERGPTPIPSSSKAGHSRSSKRKARYSSDAPSPSKAESSKKPRRKEKERENRGPERDDKSREKEKRDSNKKGKSRDKGL